MLGMEVQETLKLGISFLVSHSTTACRNVTMSFASAWDGSPGQKDTWLCLKMLG